MSEFDKIALVPQPTSVAYLSRAMNPSRSREERHGCWIMSCEAFWLEAVTLRSFPVFRQYVTQRAFKRE